ncbi:MAG: MCE family protein [Deltaproteobacteria bacterium]|nr:MAG: MCE family protein [Deltaproteobacteria bacterium]
MRWLTRLTTIAVILAVIAVAALAVRTRVPTIHVRGTFRTYVKFHDGSRLAAGSPVVIAGVRVGVIEKLTIEGGLARIDMRLRDGLDLPVDSFATRRADSLFGDSYVEIIPSPGEGAAPARLLRSGEPITHVVEGGSTDAVLRAIGTALPRIDNTLDTMHDGVLTARSWVAGPFTDRMNRTDQWLTEGHVEGPIESADRAVSRLDDAVTRARDAVAGGGPDVLDTLDRIDRGVDSARTRMRDVQSGLVSTLQDTRDGLDRIDPQIEQARDVMSAIDEGRGDDWRGSLGRLVNQPQLGDRIEDITDTARDAVGGLNRFKSWLGMRVELDAYSRDVRFYATAQLRARNDKFYLVEFERGPIGGLPHDQLSDVANASGYVRQQVIPDHFRFTAQFGKQFGPLALRGGLKDSTFGIGADATMLDGRLQLSADLFGAFQATPRLKLTGAFAVFRTMYVLGGVDDALNSPGYLQVLTGSASVPTTLDKVRYGRDYFVGTMLQFTDEDIAMMLRVYGALMVGLVL